MVFDLDQRLGELVDKLEQKGLAEQTAVVLVSDHGDMMGISGMVQKRCFYEPSIRVPLVAALPGAKAAGVRVDTPVSLVDLLPTFAELAGVKSPEGLPGVSLCPSLHDRVEPPARTLLCKYRGEGVHAPCFLAIRGTPRYVLVHGYEERLCDIAADPEQWVNRILEADYAEAAHSLKADVLDNFNPGQIEASARQSLKNRRSIRSTTS